MIEKYQVKGPVTVRKKKHWQKGLQKQSPRGVPKKGVLKICSKFTG